MAKLSTHRALRFGLGAIELVVGLAAVGGAVALIRDGAGMPGEWLSRTPFHSWVLPGVALLVIVGGSQLGAAVALATGRSYARIVSILAGLGLVAWIVVQVTLLRRYHPMQPTILAIGCLTAALAYRLPRSTRTAGDP